jgi:hypothetical protein
MQKAADAAALAGAREVSETANLADAARIVRAKEKAGAVLAEVAPAGTAGSFEVLLDARRVTVLAHHAEPKTFFRSFLANASEGLRAKAVATYEGQPAAACFLALDAEDSVGIGLHSATSITAKRCSLWSNATTPVAISVTAAASMEAKRICSAGGVVTARRLRITPEPEQHCPPLKDPLAAVDLRNTAPCDFRDRVVGRDTEVIGPGVYCGGLRLTGATLLMSPGLYVIRDGDFDVAGPRVTGAGVSILLQGSARLIVGGGSTRLTLTAMATGPLAGIAIASDAPKQANLASEVGASADVTLRGSLYLPGHFFRMRGSPTVSILGPTDRMIVRSFSQLGEKGMTGSGDLILGADDNLLRASASHVLRLIE